MTPHDSLKLRILAAVVAACVLLIVGYSQYTAIPVRNVALPTFSGNLPSSPTRLPAAGPDSDSISPPVPTSNGRVDGPSPPAGAESPKASADEPPGTASRTALSEATLPRLGSGPMFLLRHTEIDLSYGRLAIDSGAGGEGSRQATDLTCQVVHFAGNRGSCLDARRSAVTTFTAILFDATFRPTARIPLTGSPSRTRVSPDGRYVATTVFVSGHSYADDNFSTETQIVDAITGRAVVANLEQMEVWSRDGRITAAEANFWGVTFTADSNRFYATLGIDDMMFLVHGDIAANRMNVVAEGIECPSLSPDNTRIAGKKRLAGGAVGWRLYVLDLATLVAKPVAESRLIDEQVEWLDNDRLLYTQPAAGASSRAVTDVWTIAADGSGKPELLLRSAASPTMFRRPTR